MQLYPQHFNESALTQFPSAPPSVPQEEKLVDWHQLPSSLILSPKWHESSRVHSIASKIFIYLGIAFTAAALFAATLFKAAPLKLIKTVSSLALLSTLLLVIGISIRKFLFSKNDPVYALKLRIEAGQAIDKQQLGYSAIHARYRDLIELGIISPPDIQGLIHQDLMNLSFEDFQKKHDPDLFILEKPFPASMLQILKADQNLFNIFREKFIEFLIQEAGPKYTHENLKLCKCQELNLALHDIVSKIGCRESLLLIRSSLTYESFIKRNGTEIIPYLIPEAYSCLSHLFIAFIKDTHQGVNQFLIQFRKEIDLFQIIKNDVIQAILQEEIKAFQNNEMTYQALADRNDFTLYLVNIFDQDVNLKEKAKADFLKMTYSEMLSLKRAKERHTLEIAEENIQEVINQAAANLPYVEFRKRHGDRPLFECLNASNLDKIKQKVKSLSTLDALIDHFSIDLFKHDLLKQDTHLIQLVKEWIILHSRSYLLEEMSSHCDILHHYQLIPFNIKNLIFLFTSQARNAKTSHENEIKKINFQGNIEKQQLLQNKLSEIQQFEKEANLEKLIDKINFERANKENLEKVILDYQKQTQNHQQKLNQNQTEIQTYQRQSPILFAELAQMQMNAPLLESQIKQTQTAIEEYRKKIIDFETQMQEAIKKSPEIANIHEEINALQQMMTPHLLIDQCKQKKIQLEQLKSEAKKLQEELIKDSQQLQISTESIDLEQQIQIEMQKRMQGVQGLFNAIKQAASFQSEANLKRMQNLLAKQRKFEQIKKELASLENFLLENQSPYETLSQTIKEKNETLEKLKSQENDLILKIRSKFEVSTIKNQKDELEKKCQKDSKKLSIYRNKEKQLKDIQFSLASLKQQQAGLGQDLNQLNIQLAYYQPSLITQNNQYQQAQQVHEQQKQIFEKNKTHLEQVYSSRLLEINFRFDQVISAEQQKHEQKIQDLNHQFTKRLSPN